jgi:hypothetical protein
MGQSRFPAALMMDLTRRGFERGCSLNQAVEELP